MEETSNDTAKWRLNLGKYLDQERSVAGEWCVSVRNLVILSTSISHFFAPNSAKSCQIWMRGEWKLCFVRFLFTFSSWSKSGDQLLVASSGSFFILDRNATLVCVEL